MSVRIELCTVLHGPVLSFLIHISQGIVDFLHLRSQYGKLATNICSNLLLTMKTFVFFNMLRDFFGYYVVVTKQVAEERRKFVSMVLGSGFFHKSDFGGAWFLDLGSEKMPYVD